MSPLSVADSEVSEPIPAAERPKAGPEIATAVSAEAPAERERGRPEGPERGRREPTVKVSIGRVEVRVADSPARAKPAPRKPAAPSLADYLAGERRRGR